MDRTCRPSYRSELWHCVFQDLGMCFRVQHSTIIAWSSERRNAHFCKMMIEIWSSGQAELDRRQRFTAVATSLYVGGESSKSVVGGCNDGIQLGIVLKLWTLKIDNTRRKYDEHRSIANVGTEFVALLNISLQALQNFIFKLFSNCFPALITSDLFNFERINLLTNLISWSSALDDLSCLRMDLRDLTDSELYTLRNNHPRHHRFRQIHRYFGSKSSNHRSYSVLPQQSDRNWLEC